MRRAAVAFAFLLIAPLAGCTGLVAGNQVQASSTVPVTSDSAWARARRGFTAEVMTVSLADSNRGVLIGRRYARVAAEPTAVERCNVLVKLNLQPEGDGTALKWETQWVAPEAMASAQSKTCDEERDGVQARIQQTIAP